MSYVTTCHFQNIHPTTNSPRTFFHFMTYFCRKSQNFPSNSNQLWVRVDPTERKISRFLSFSGHVFWRAWRKKKGQLLERSILHGTDLSLRVRRDQKKTCRPHSFSTPSIWIGVIGTGHVKIRAVDRTFLIINRIELFGFQNGKREKEDLVRTRSTSHQPIL